MSPELTFLHTNKVLAPGGVMLPIGDALSLIGAAAGVTPVIVRWRVAQGWELKLAVTTPYKPTPLRTAALPQPGKKGKILSKYTGVYWMPKHKRWRARAWKGGKQYDAGYYESEVHAAHARDIRAIMLHGPDVRLNFSSPPINRGKLASEMLVESPLR